MDFQLYAMAPIAFLVLYKLGRKGVYWLLILLVIGIIIPPFNRFVMGDLHAYEILSHQNAKQIMLGWKSHYWGPLNYIQTQIIGMLLAYAVRYHPKAYLGGPIGHVIIWLTTFSITLGHMYWQKDMIMPGFQYGPYEHYLYLFFHKPLYLSWFAWLIYGTSTGRWGLNYYFRTYFEYNYNKSI